MRRCLPAFTTSSSHWITEHSSYVLAFPTSNTAPVEGVEEGEVEYEMTREQWLRRHDEYDSE